MNVLGGPPHGSSVHISRQQRPRIDNAHLGRARLEEDILRPHIQQDVAGLVKPFFGVQQLALDWEGIVIFGEAKGEKAEEVLAQPNGNP